MNPTPSCSGVRLLALVACATSFGACRTTEATRASHWPPPDFWLDVRSYVRAGDHEEERQRFTVWPDGTALYREAATGVGGPRAGTRWFPVFDKAAAYRLAPQSLRRLARWVDEAGTFERSQLGETRGDAAQSLALAVRARGDVRVLLAEGTLQGPMQRLVHVVNAFLPAAASFTLPEVLGEPEPQQLLYVPEPEISLPGALALHRQLLLQRPDDPDLLLDTFALALASGEHAEARDLLERLRRRVAQGAGGPIPFEEAGPPDLVSQLERLLPR
jgi:hypothetical protein